MAINRSIPVALAALFLSLSLQAQEDAFKADSLVTLPWQAERTVLSTTGSMMSVNEAQLEKAPIQDLRRRLTGLFPGLVITENTGGIHQKGYLGSPFMGSGQITVNSRGFTQVACIVDDIPLPFNQYLLDPAQIESITLLTDVADKASVGPVASLGALYIKTKKGGYNTPLRIHADLESGVDFAGVWPEWVDGATYARMNNTARTAAGYSTLYSDADIQGFAKNDPLDLKTPSVDYKSLMMRDFKPISRFSLNANAGSDNIKYNISVSALNDNSLLKVGPTSDFNKINMSSSITVKIGQYIEANASFLGSLGYYRGLSKCDFTSYRRVPPVAFPLQLTVEEDSPLYDPNIMSNARDIYGVSRTYDTNYYAAALEGGGYTERRRSGSFYTTFDLDMSWLLPGLKSKTFLNLSTFYFQTPGKVEDYIAYYWNPTDIIEEISSHTGIKNAAKTDLDSGSYQGLSWYEQLSYGLNKGAHKLDLAGTFFMSSASSYLSMYNQRQLYLVGTAKYGFANRFFLDLVANYAGSSRFYKTSRFAWFPAVGASWVISNEEWLKHSPVLTFAKLHAQAGKIGDAGFDDTANYLWQGKYDIASSMSYGPYSANQWFGSKTLSSSATVLSRVHNYGLTWPTITQFDAGVELSLFDCLDMKANWYRMMREGLIDTISSEYSDVFGYQDTDLYQNYSALLYTGYELSLQFHKNLGDFAFNVGTMLRHWDITYQKWPDNYYLYDYQNVIGRSLYDVEGYKCIGKFASDQEILSSPLFSSDTQVGDLKYEDLNKDGKIDPNDICVVGNTEPTLRYTLNLDLMWKGFNLSVIGSGALGGQVELNDEVFWGGWGDGVYSQFMADNVGGDYPRLSYDKVEGNFQMSDFWIRKNDYFKIKSAELGYIAHFRGSRFVKSMKVSLRGANLLTFTSLKYVDPEAVHSGVDGMPLFRTVTAGVKLNF